MARMLSQTLIRDSRSLHPDHYHLLAGATAVGSPLAARLLAHRGRTDRPEKARLIEVDLGSSEAEAGDEVEVEVEVISIRRLQDVIHGAIVRRAAPDWLPFVPGSSYWVPPPKRALGLVEVVAKLPLPMTEEESLSHLTTRGFPSSKYFMEGVTSNPAKKNSKKAAAQSDDEE